MKKTIKELISQSFYRLLGSIVRLALRNGLTYKEFSAIAKQLYVRVSLEEYGLQGRPTNMARVSLMTGLDRKESKKIADTITNVTGNESEEMQGLPSAPDKMAKILTTWHESPIYKDKNNRPLEIPITGPAPSFEHLVKSYGGDIAVVTVLREFKRSQTISENSTGKTVRVRKRHYIPNYLGGAKSSPELVDPEAIAQGSSMLIDHINTIFHNLYRENMGLREKFDLRATNASIHKDSVDDFYKLIDRKGMKFLEDVDLWLSQHEVTEDSDNSERLGVGLYFIAGENDRFPDKKS